MLFVDFFSIIHAFVSKLLMKHYVKAMFSPHSILLGESDI